MIVYNVRELVKRYPGRERPANNGITFSIEQGEIFGLLGDNGAGKTTLVRQMVNLLQPSSGSIALFGQELGRDALLVPRYVGYMPQSGQALNNLTVAEALYFTAHLRGLGRAAAQRERDGLIELWTLQASRDVPVPRLSGGQRRLLQIAVAMAGNPQVLILDEPTANLDPQRRKQVWDVLGGRNREQGTTIILITHDAIEAEKVISRVGIMRDGELVALGRPAALKRELDHQLRLELFFAPERPPKLPAGLDERSLGPGHLIVYLDRGAAQAILNTLDLTQVDDFRLYSATLEDLYMHYAAST